MSTADSVLIEVSKLLTLNLVQVGMAANGHTDVAPERLSKIGKVISRCCSLSLFALN